MRRTKFRFMDAADAVILRQRIEERVIQQPDGCWKWTKARNKGYGQMRFKNKLRDTHVWSYLAWNGNIPANHHIDHTCNNEICCNPAHLEAVTQKVNNQRMSKRGRNGMSKKTHCPHGHPYSEENTRYIKNSSGTLSRKCRACRGSTKPRAKLNKNSAREIRVLAKMGVPRKKLAAKYSVGNSTVDNIVQGKTWKHV